MKPEQPYEDPAEIIKRMQKEFRSSHGSNKMSPVGHKNVGGNNWANHVASALEEKEREEDERWHHDD